jgi:hypothetical protein
MLLYIWTFRSTDGIDLLNSFQPNFTDGSYTSFAPSVLVSENNYRKSMKLAQEYQQTKKASTAPLMGGGHSPFTTHQQHNYCYIPTSLHLIVLPQPH